MKQIGIFALGVAVTIVCMAVVAPAGPTNPVQESSPPDRNTDLDATEKHGDGKKNDHWLHSDWDNAREQTERHFRGLDVAMMEIGHRFNELHFAGIDRNWPYAQYQVEKIELALKLALERRPKRAKSAEPFLRETIPYVKKAIQAASKRESTEPFEDVVGRMRTDCMKCHVEENVPHFTVYLTETRTSVIGTGESP